MAENPAETVEILAASYDYAEQTHCNFMDGVLFSAPSIRA
jgi:hypothetical protein